MTTQQVLRLIVKPLVFVAALGPVAWLTWAGVTGNLSVNPLSDLTNETGVWALRFLCISIAITPLRRLTGWNWVIRFRRMLGLFAFFYGTLHFLITAGLLLWVYLRRHEHYRQYRNLLGMTTALALIGYFAFPLAPRACTRVTIVSSTRSTRSAVSGRTTPAQRKRSPTRLPRCPACTSDGHCGAAPCCGRSQDTLRSVLSA